MHGVEEGQKTVAPCMSNCIHFKTQLMGRKDDKNNKTLHMPTTVPTEGPRSSGRPLRLVLGWPLRGRCSLGTQSLLLPSSAVCLGVCVGGTAWAEPRCS